MILMCCFRPWRYLLNIIIQVCKNILIILWRLLICSKNSLPCADRGQALFFTMLAGLSVALSAMEVSPGSEFSCWHILEKSEEQPKGKHHRTFGIAFCVKFSQKGSVLVALLKVCEMIFICLVM